MSFQDDLVWAGTDRGSVFSFKVDTSAGRLSKAHRHVVAEGFKVTNIVTRNSRILVNVSNNSLLVFSQAGTFIKAALQGDEDFSNLRDIRRFKDFLIVMKTSCKERPTSGRVMWYRLKGKSQ